MANNIDSNLQLSYLKNFIDFLELKVKILSIGQPSTKTNSIINFLLKANKDTITNLVHIGTSSNQFTIEADTELGKNIAEAIVLEKNGRLDTLVIDQEIEKELSTSKYLQFTNQPVAKQDKFAYMGNNDSSYKNASSQYELSNW